MSLPVTKVLLIDDSETDRYTYRRYLEKSSHPYEVSEAHDAQSGLALAESLNPDCILLDLKLKSGESGYEVLQKLVGEDPPYKRTVIMLTVVSMSYMKEGAISLGATDFLVKGETNGIVLDDAIQRAIKKTPRKS
jgi:DNA-binding NarL/FixJ family response regulator